MLYKGLPRGLQHLAFGVDADTPLAPIVQAIKRSDDLRAITMQVWHGGEQHPQLAAVKIACGVKGVELRQTNDVPEFRAITVRIIAFSSARARMAYGMLPDCSVATPSQPRRIPARAPSTTSSTWLHALL